MCFSYVFLAAGPYYELSQEEAAKAAAEAKASKASEESGDRWVAKPQWKTVETQGKPPWKSPLFPTSSGKISKNILRNCGKSNVISVFFSRYFNYHFLLHSVCWFGHRTGMIHSCDENILVWLFQHVETTKSFNWLMLRVPKV
jgi:hypothetical protein